jgi:hypothetical protein
MTQSTRRAAGSTAPIDRVSEGHSYPVDEQNSRSPRRLELPFTQSFRRLRLNVIPRADSISRSWYSQVFPEVFLNGIEEMHRRSNCSGNDAEPFDEGMRSNS